MKVAGRAGVIVAAVSLAASVATMAAAETCVGDCSADGTVTIEELVWGVNLTYDAALLDDCRAFDPTGNGSVTIDELLVAINSALGGCPSSSFTPSATPTESPEPTATESPEATATESPDATATQSPEPVATESPESTATASLEPTATETAEATASETEGPTATETAESTVMPSPEPTAGAPVGFRPGVSIRSSDLDRSYALFVPLDYDPGRAYPVVFAFHGDGGTGAALRDALGLEAQAGGAALFVYPDATDESGRSFDLETPLAANADMQLFVDILTALESTYSINRERVFATGLSRGAFFVNFLNCRFGDHRLRAIAAHSGSGPYGPAAEYDVDGHFLCEAPAAAALMIHGTNDMVVPLNDALYSRGQWSWANGCSDETAPQAPEPCERHEACQANKPVVWCAVDGLGHEIWDGAAQAIWSFFAALL